MASLTDLQAQLVGAFFEESFEGLDKVEAGLLELERPGLDAGQVKCLVDEIFRAAHSLKGGAGTFGFAAITDVAHVMETVLDRVRVGTLSPAGDVGAALLATVDGLRGLLEGLRDGRPLDLAPVQPVLDRLQALALPAQPASATPPAKPPSSSLSAHADRSAPGWRIHFRPHPGLLRSGNDPARLLRELSRLGPTTVTVDVQELPPLRELVVDDSYLAWHIVLGAPVPKAALDELFSWVEGDCDLAFTPLELLTSAAPESGAPLTQRNDAPVGTRTESSEPVLASIRIGIDKVDLLMNMVGELVITQSMLGELREEGPLDATQLARVREGLSQLARNTRALQESVMRLRSVPISVVFNRFPRLVHDLSQQLGKRVELKLAGQNTELDKTVLEKLGDPMVHLVRNCLDHGFEPPDERLAAGKPASGTLTLLAFHHGSDIVVQVTDDGRGLDLDRLLERGRARDLVVGDKRPSDAEIRDLIFAPGFSTAAAVTDLSGRGVGMDVVRQNVRALGGEVTVESEAGRGTKVSLRLPLTLAIIDGQLVRVGAHPYVVPLLAIVESGEIDRTRVRGLGDREVYRLRDELVPMTKLHELMGGTAPGGAAGQATRQSTSHATGQITSEGLLVVVEGDGRKLGLVVDEILGLQQVVVKSLEANYERVPGLAGATILGDGSVAFILDICGLVTLMHDRAPPRPRRSAQGTAAPRAPVVGLG